MEFDFPEYWRVTVGKPFSSLANSKFCDVAVLALYNEFLQKSKVGGEGYVVLYCHTQSFSFE
jgi:hypothetical protein